VSDASNDCDQLRDHADVDEHRHSVEAFDLVACGHKRSIWNIP
jgi:hypothetical protein